MKPIAENTDKPKFQSAILFRQFQAGRPLKYDLPREIKTPYKVTATIGHHGFATIQSRTRTGSYFASQLQISREV